MALDLPTAHRRALEETGLLVAGVRADQWGLPTPCTDWDVRALVNHIVAENLWVAPLVEGRSIAEVGNRYEGDVLGADPVDAYEASAVACDAAFSSEGAMDAPIGVSYGPVPGADYCGHRLLDLLVHGWDLAVATGQEPALDPELVDLCWQLVEPQLAFLEASGVFAAPVPVADAGGVQARLLGALGRDPVAGA